MTRLAILSLGFVCHTFGQTFNSYHIGNSLTAQTLSHAGYSLDDLTAARGINNAWGYQIRCGSQLNQTYANPTDTCMEPKSPYGYFRDALPYYSWNAVTLQPYGDPMAAGISAANGLIDLTRQRYVRSSATFYVMAMWPQGESSDSYATRWNRPYNEISDDYESRWSRQYFVNFAQHLRADQPGVKVGTVLSGEVIYQFDQLSLQGQISGYSSAAQLYGDPYHLSPDGSYLSRMTLFATMYHTSPVGLPAPSNVTFAPDDLRKLQQMVWSTVTGNASLSLVLSADSNRDLKVDSSDFNMMAGHFGSTTYLNSQGDFDGDGQVSSLDFNTLLSQYGTNISPGLVTGNAVPEPGIVALLPTGIVMLLSRRRKHQCGPVGFAVTSV